MPNKCITLEQLDIYTTAVVQPAINRIKQLEQTINSLNQSMYLANQRISELENQLSGNS